MFNNLKIGKNAYFCSFSQFSLPCFHKLLIINFFQVKERKQLMKQTKGKNNQNTRKTKQSPSLLGNRRGGSPFFPFLLFLFSGSDLIQRALDACPLCCLGIWDIPKICFGVYMFSIYGIMGDIAPFENAR